MPDSSAASVNNQLIDAINTQTLRPVLAGLVADPAGWTATEWDRISNASEVVAGIDRAVDGEIIRLTSLLTEAGVTFDTMSAAEPDRVLHIIALAVPWGLLESTASVLEAAGYHCSLRDDRVRWGHFAGFNNTCTFIGSDELEFRVQLSWGSPGGVMSKIPAQLRPSFDDLDAVPLPAKLSGLYAVVKPVRQVLGKRQPGATALGPFLGTPDGLIAELLEFSGVAEGAELVDLGCGDGRVLIEAAERYGCTAVGYETDPTLVEAANTAAKQSDNQRVAGNVVVHLADAQTADVSTADVVFIFLPVAALEVLVPDLLQRMKQGAVLLAHEQERLSTSVEPDARLAMVHPSGITVAHKWSV